MIAFLLKISIVYAAGVLLLYGIAALNRKLAKMTRKKPEESEHAWMEEESNPCHDDICFFCGKDIDERLFFVQHMHRAVGEDFSTAYEDKAVSIPCCEGCLAANTAAAAKADRNNRIAALLALAAVFAALMYLFHGHSGAWLAAASNSILAGIAAYHVTGKIAKPAYRKKVEEYPVVATSRGKSLEVGAAPGEKPAAVCRILTRPGGATMELIYCPPGEFMMGSPASEVGRDDDEEQHRVKLTKGFWLGKYAVTQRQWKSVMGNDPSKWKGDNLPVESVSWDDCQEFIGKVNKRLKCGARLPTEAEWEYACRAGTSTAYSWGNVLNGVKANCCGKYPCGTDVKGVYLERTVEVDKYAPNPWGFYCMHGNVGEWCSDWYGYDYYKFSPANDPRGPDSGTRRVMRGGGWDSFASFCRSAFRLGHFLIVSRCEHDCGFRLCCSEVG